MTAIVGLVDNGSVWMGGDAAGVAGYHLQTRSDPKVFINGEMLFGFTSSFRMGQLLRYEFTPPVPFEGENGMAYMVKRVVPAIKRCFDGGGFLRTEDGEDRGGEFLIGYRGAMYLLHSDFQVAQLRTSYASCGCGRDLCLGSMHTSEGVKMRPRERILAALEAAAAGSAGVRPPFTVEQLRS